MNRLSFRALLFPALLSALFLQDAQAGGVLVNSTSDQPQPGLISLREAIELANSTTNAIIAFDANLFATPQTIVLENGELSITEGMTIVGPGADLLTIDAGGSSRVLTVNVTDVAADVFLSDMTLSNGFSTAAGGCINNHERLTLRAMVIAGCHTDQNGGGLHSFQAGNLQIENSHFINNSSGRDGGGVFAQNGNNNQITGSTFSGNLADRLGGGLATQQVIDFDIVNSTFSGNAAPSGAGISGSANTSILQSTVVFNIGDGIRLVEGQLLNSLIAANSGADCVFVNTGFDNQNNLDTDGSCGVGASNHQTVADPMLSALANYGGLTPSHLPLPGSPAVDAGDDTLCPDHDQRGMNRPQDGDDNGSALCDIGAIERQLFEDTVFTGGFDF